MATRGQSQAPAEESRGFIRAMGLFPATSLNMAQMVGIGPFITIPLIISAIGGPQVMIGWVVGALIALCDGLVWAELGASMPRAGGTYNFLRQAFQYSTGKFMPFMFVWSTLLVTPLIMATGMIGMTDYLGYFWHMTTTQSHWIAVGFTVLTVALLYRRIDRIARLTKILWAGMIVTVVLYLVAAYSHFHASLAFSFPHGAFDLGAGAFWTGLGAALTLAIYDYLGYYTVAYLGDEVRDPGRVIPRSIIISVVAVLVIDLSMNIGTIGVIPWQQAEKSTSIGSDLLHHVWGGAGAATITILIIWTAFASVFTGLLGASRLPFSAARERLFFSPFGRLHPQAALPAHLAAGHGPGHRDRVVLLADHGDQRADRPGYLGAVHRADRRADHPAAQAARAAPPVPAVAVPGAEPARADRLGLHLPGVGVGRHPDHAHLDRGRHHRLPHLGARRAFLAVRAQADQRGVPARGCAQPSAATVNAER